MQKRLCVSVLVLLAFALPAAAHWNDCRPPQPPPPPSVCDGYSGIPRVLCATYCELLNCDSRTLQSTAKICQQVESLFKCATKKSLPCAPTGETCPCTQLGLFAAVLNGNAPISLCVSGGGNTSVEGPNGNFVLVTENLTCSENGLGAMINLTASQALLCGQLLRDAAAAQNVVCIQPE